MSAEGHNFTKLTAHGVFWFHACLLSLAVKQLSLSSVAFGVTREILLATSILNVIDTKCRHIVPEVQFWGKGIYFHFHRMLGILHLHFDVLKAFLLINLMARRL